MNYFTDLFSPETYEAFMRSSRDITGFRIRQRKSAERVRQGDRFLCYMTKLSLWMGVLEVTSDLYIDDAPRFYPTDDPFVVRFKVNTIAWLAKDRALPIHDDSVWSQLSFTRESEGAGWTGMLRRSLNQLKYDDGCVLEKLIREQANGGRQFEVDEDRYRRLVTQRIRREDKVVSVSVPTDEDKVEVEPIEPTGIRESASVQAMLASLGEKMGFKVWLPRNDRSTVLKEWTPESGVLIDLLPLNYDETTLQTIEQIDVLWLKGRSIVRAFEVEHTTAVYSGILRMADLLALQPNMDIKLHIVAPAHRRDRVLTEIQRPVFSLLDRGPLSESCTFIPYDSLREIAGLKHVEHLSDSVLDEYVEEAD